MVTMEHKIILKQKQNLRGGDNVIHLDFSISVRWSCNRLDNQNERIRINGPILSCICCKDRLFKGMWEKENRREHDTTILDIEDTVGKEDGICFPLPQNLQNNGHKLQLLKF